MCFSISVFVRCEYRFYFLHSQKSKVVIDKNIYVASVASGFMKDVEKILSYETVKDEADLERCMWC